MRGGHVLDGEAQRLEHRDLVVGAPPVHAAEEHFAQLALHVIVADGPFRARDEEVARLRSRPTRGGRRRHAPAPPPPSPARGRCAGSRPTALTCVPARSHAPSSTGSREAVTVQTMSASATASRALGGRLDRRSRWRFRAASTKRATWAGSRLHTRTRRSGRTSATASRCVAAWTPLPSRARVLASARASARVATPDTAAVRMAVIELASITARRRPRSVSNRSTAPWCES